MTETPAAPADHSPQTPAPSAVRKLPLRAIVAGVGFGALAFLFGGFAAILAVPGALPGTRKLRTMCIALLLSVPCWLLFWALVGNPLVWLAREQALNHFESVLGERPDYLSCDGEPLTGKLRFRKIAGGIRDWQGRLRIHEFELQSGFAFIAPADGVAFAGKGANLELHTDMAGLVNWGKSLSRRKLPRAEGVLEGVVLSLLGPDVGATMTLEALGFELTEDSLHCQAAPRVFDIALLGRVHRFAAQGDVFLAAKGGESEITADLHLNEGLLGTAVVNGRLSSLQPQDRLRMQIDSLKLAPMWARYRAIDVLEGLAKGTVDIGPAEGGLTLDMDIEMRDVRYFHRTAMRLQEGRAFLAEHAKFTAAVKLAEGKPPEFADLRLWSPRCTLSSDKKVGAKGFLGVRVAGAWPRLKGGADVIVTEGRIDEPIRFTGLGEGLSAITPNVIDLVELLPSLELKLDSVQVKNVVVAAEPLSGTLAGTLEGTLERKENSPARVRLKGRLNLEQGKFEFLGASGDISGYIEFQANTPPAQATIRGDLRGTAADTPLAAEITGRLGAPGFIFKHVTMSPDKLGLRIVQAGEEKLTAEQRAERTIKFNRLCGPLAVTQRNPFAVSGQGAVFFEFRPGE